MVTGTNTTESSHDSEGSTPKEALQEELQIDAGQKRLGKMIGMKSVHRNLKAEDEAYARELETQHRELWGETPESKGDDEMEVMAARDVIVNPAPAQQPQQQNNSLPKWVLPAMAAVMTTGGIGAGFGLSQWLAPNDDRPAVSDRINDVSTGFGQPIDRE